MISPKVMSLRHEMLELRERNEELQDVSMNLQMERTLLFNPAVSYLEHSQNENTHLESQLVEEQELAKKLSSRLSYSIEENQRYRDALEHKDDTFRRKEESSKHAMHSLHRQIGALQSENDELKRDLVRYELDIMRLRQRELRHDAVEEEKVRDGVEPEVLSQIQGTVQIMVTAVDDEDPRSETGDSMRSLSVSPGEVGGFEGRRTRRSIVMSIHDLASIVRKSETVNDENVCSHCLGSYLNVLDELPGAQSDGSLMADTTMDTEVETERWNALKEENAVLTQKVQRGQRQIDSLTDTIATMQMQNAKQQNCRRFMPWCG